MSGRIIHSNQSLVLQKVTRQSAGRYVCSVVNSEGERSSNELNFRVQCKLDDHKDKENTIVRHILENAWSVCLKPCLITYNIAFLLILYLSYVIFFQFLNIFFLLNVISYRRFQSFSLFSCFCLAPTSSSTSFLFIFVLFIWHSTFKQKVHK